MSVTITKNYLTNNDCYKSGRTITPIGMQLHTVGTAQNSSSSLASYWNQSGISACVHYCIDAETEGKVLQFLPENYRSWADGGFGNNSLITVELMESDYMKYTSGANFTITNETKFKADITRAYNTAVEFFAQICKNHGWKPTTKLSNGLYLISSHYEGAQKGVSTSHVDPTHVWAKLGFTMDKFRSDVTNAMSGSATSSSTTSSSTSTSKTTDSYYRVGTSWKDGKCVNQTGAFSSLANAKAEADKQMNANKKTYRVYDSSGTKVYAVKYVEPTVYVVQAGSFSKKADATALVTKLKAKGFDAIIKIEDSTYKVQCGSFSIKANATALVNKLKAVGFEAVVK